MMKEISSSVELIIKIVIRLCIASVFLWGINSWAAAEEDCHETAMTQMDMNICAHEDVRKANADLDKVYNKLLAKSSSAGKVRLELARDAWKVYRAEECDFESMGSITGSIHPMILSNCYAYLTNEYTKLLDRHLHCVEGDSSCGGQ